MKTKILSGLTVASLMAMPVFSGFFDPVEAQSINPMAESSCADYGVPLSDTGLRSIAAANPDGNTILSYQDAVRNLALTSLGVARNSQMFYSNVQKFNPDGSFNTIDGAGVIPDAVQSQKVKITEPPLQEATYTSLIFTFAIATPGDFTSNTLKGQQLIRAVKALSRIYRNLENPSIGIGGVKPIPTIVFVTPSTTTISPTFLADAYYVDTPILIVQRFICQNQSAPIPFKSDLIVGKGIPLNFDYLRYHYELDKSVDFSSSPGRPSSLFSTWAKYNSASSPFSYPDPTATVTLSYAPSSPPLPTPPFASPCPPNSKSNNPDCCSCDAALAHKSKMAVAESITDFGEILETARSNSLPKVKSLDMPVLGEWQGKSWSKKNS